MQPRSDEFAATGWAELHGRLAELRADLSIVAADGRPDLVRCRELRQQVAACIAAISTYHQRPADSGDKPPSDGAPTPMPPRPMRPGG